MRCSSLQADIELLQKEVVAQLELTKDFFETFDKEKLQTFSKTEGDVETTMMKSRTSDNIQTTSTSFLSPDFMADQRNEILRLRKLLDEASKRELDLKNKSPSINTSINCVNVSQIMDIMRALVPVIKDYKKYLILLGHVIYGSIFAFSAVSIILIVILLFLDYDEDEARPWNRSHKSLKRLAKARQELAKEKADIELVQNVMEKGKRALTTEEQVCISKYDGVVAQLELTKDLLKTFYEKNSKTEGTSTSINIPPTTSTSFISPDPMDDQGNEILRLRKQLDEAEKRELDLKNKIPSINTSINCVNVSQIMDILRALVLVIKDYKNELLLLGHIINGWILFLFALSIILIAVLLFLNYDEGNARPWVRRLALALLIISVITNFFYISEVKSYS
ncbi:hypothetical protein DAPPUDRAFT_315330 [Daphnia pulex]|uniref:Uncharacterized protein n=1 Tax=Daphnia pulex TaxID=6669 RepID=E9G9F3_DAPPU|nr:hypothetical protein DAPPUDRAFT_315330 [Daphnia pulex]|eukprot:EFX83550.1 hypothetical protein DAPPUDRAFT_315330 [Daphnia pulex]